MLLVFAEAPGSRPLAMRLERERLRALFEEEILPHRKVRIEILCHGVTRKVLHERISKRKGFPLGVPLGGVRGAERGAGRPRRGAGERW